MFTDEYKWKKLFYRIVDSMDADQGQQLRNIEEGIFTNVKEEVEKELGEWSGCKEQNCLADHKISAAVKSSFRNYEENAKSGNQKSFFKFK